MPSYHGLTAAEVEARRAAGQTNQPPASQTKTTGEIVRDNVCTSTLFFWYWPSCWRLCARG